MQKLCSRHREEERARASPPRTCSAMIPKSPKQAYCTRFLLSTRMQPAAKDEGKAQRLRPDPVKRRPHPVKGGPTNHPEGKATSGKPVRGTDHTHVNWTLLSRDTVPESGPLLQGMDPFPEWAGPRKLLWRAPGRPEKAPLLPRKVPGEGLPPEESGQEQKT